jgi:hypothetical protein
MMNSRSTERRRQRRFKLLWHYYVVTRARRVPKPRKEEHVKSPRIRQLEQAVKREKSWEELLKEYLTPVIEKKFEIYKITPSHLHQRVLPALADEDAILEHLKQVYGEHAYTAALAIGFLARAANAAEPRGQKSHQPNKKRDYFLRGISLLLQGKTAIIIGKNQKVQVLDPERKTSVQIDGNLVKVKHPLDREERVATLKHPFTGILVSDKTATIHDLHPARPEKAVEKEIREHLLYLPNRSLILVPHVNENGEMTGKMALFVLALQAKEPKITVLPEEDWREIELLKEHRELIKRATKMEFTTLGDLAQHIQEKYGIPPELARETAQGILNMINHLYYTMHRTPENPVALALVKGQQLEFEPGERIHEPRFFDPKGREYRPHEYDPRFVPEEIHIPVRYGVVKIRKSRKYASKPRTY